MPPRTRRQPKPRKTARKGRKPARRAPSPGRRKASAHLERGMPEGADRSALPSAVHEVSWADFDRLVQEMARALAKAFKPDAVVGIAHGGVFVGGALASALGRDFYPVRISRRSRDHQADRPRLRGQMPRELKGRRVVIADDIASSGDTLELATALARAAGATQVATATLVSRPRGFRPDFAAVKADDFFVFPWDYQPVAQDARFDVDPDQAGA